jgi:hypothetical protein
MDEEKLIRSNILAVLSAREVKAKTGQIPGDWTLLDDEIQYFHGMPSNVEFTVIFVNGSTCLKVSAKLHRKSGKISNIKVDNF